MHYILIAHGGWHESDGQPRGEREVIYKLPKNLKIRTYNAPGVVISKKIGLVLLKNLMSKGGELGLKHGLTLLEGKEELAVDYKEYAENSLYSSYIANYSISGDDNYPAGLYEIPNTTPIIQMDSTFRAYLADIIAQNHLDEKENVLHLICCQMFD